MLKPTIICDKLYDLSPQQLAEMGIKAIALDVDNTLTHHNSHDVPEQVERFLEELKQHGFLLFIISNNSYKRVKPFADNLGIEFVAAAAKPLTGGLRRCCKRFSLKKSDIILVGDQLFTDIWAAGRFGCSSALVMPLEPERSAFMRLKRRIEARFLRKMGVK